MVDRSKQIVMNPTEHVSQNDDATHSSRVALTMGFFSIILLFILSFILSVLHSLFA